MPTRPRIAIAGIHIESSTFSPQLARAEDFEVLRGDALLGRYPWLLETWAQPIDWLPVLHARALPGGVVERSAYEEWKAEILSGLRALGPLDGFFFDIHGAMSVEGLDDAEGDLITAIRAVIGPDPLVGTSMDLHGNVSHTLFSACDLLTCYRMAPHEDALESRRRAMVTLAERMLSGLGKPHKALVHIPILLPGEMTSTRIAPADRLYARIPHLTAQPGIIDAAFWIGFAWADQPRCQAAVVITGDDAARVDALALQWAEEIWQAREEFDFVAPVDSMAGCLAWARTAARPTLISDTGDNPGAGGAGDTTCALAELLAFEPVMSGELSAVVASLHDRNAAAQAWDLGVGGAGEFRLGGTIDSRPPGPQLVRAEVAHLVDAPDGGRTAALRIISAANGTPSGPAPAASPTSSASSSVTATPSLSGLLVIVTEQRKQYADLASFHRLGVAVEKADIVVVKIGYLEPDLYRIRGDWTMALTPGGVDQDLRRLGHTRIRRPMVPFDEPGFAPELRVIND